MTIFLSKLESTNFNSKSNAKHSQIIGTFDNLHAWVSFYLIGVQIDSSCRQIFELFVHSNSQGTLKQKYLNLKRWIDKTCFYLLFYREPKVVCLFYIWLPFRVLFFRQKHGRFWGFRGVSFLFNV